MGAFYFYFLFSLSLSLSLSYRLLLPLPSAAGRRGGSRLADTGAGEDTRIAKI
jgi:hypothetical protein